MISMSIFAGVFLLLSFSACSSLSPDVLPFSFHFSAPEVFCMVLLFPSVFFAFVLCSCCCSSFSFSVCVCPCLCVCVCLSVSPSFHIRQCLPVVVVKSFRAKLKRSVMHNEFANNAPNSSHKRHLRKTIADVASHASSR